MNKKEKIIHLAPLAGMLGVTIISISLLFTALTFDGRAAYSIFNHFISELGDTRESPWYIVFCIGLFISGILNTIFITGLGLYLDSRIGNWAMRIGIVAGLASSITGLIPADEALIPHLVAAITFFIGSLLTAALFGLAILKDENQMPKWMVVPSFIVSIIGIIFLVLPNELVIQFLRFDPGFVRPDFWINPFFEWLVFFSLSGWILMVSCFLMKARATKNL